MCEWNVRASESLELSRALLAHFSVAQKYVGLVFTTLFSARNRNQYLRPKKEGLKKRDLIISVRVKVCE